MSADDKVCIGSGFLAIGLAGAFILLCQVIPDRWGWLPHRDMADVEAAFDALMFFVGVPAGAYLLYRGAVDKDPKCEKQ